MKFLLIKEWQNPGILSNGVSLNKYKEMIEHGFIHIRLIVANKRLSHEIFGIAMTLFHYYVYSKQFEMRNFNRIELAVACVFLSSKINYHPLKLEELHMEYEKIINYINDKLNKGLDKIDFDSTFRYYSNQKPNILEMEINILKFINYELDIETPFKYLNIYFNRIPQNRNLIFTKNLSCNFVTDSYRWPLCVYFEPKYIALASLYLGINISPAEQDGEEEILELEDLDYYEPNFNKNVLYECLTKLFKIYDD